MDTKIDDGDQEIESYSPVCVWCARLDTTKRRRCEAFGAVDIPLEIWEGRNDHRMPYPGDNGLQFIAWNTDESQAAQSGGAL